MEGFTTVVFRSKLTIGSVGLVWTNLRSAFGDQVHIYFIR